MKPGWQCAPLDAIIDGHTLRIGGLYLIGALWVPGDQAFATSLSFRLSLYLSPLPPPPALFFGRQHEAPIGGVLVGVGGLWCCEKRQQDFAHVRCAWWQL